MLIVLLGPDDFSKKDYISSLANTEKAGVDFFVDAENLPELASLLGQDLFAKKSISVLSGLASKYDFDDVILDKLAASKNTIIIEEEKLDKRLSSSKKLLAHKGVKVQDFPLPHGAELDAWIIKFVKARGGSIGKAAVGVLAQRLGRDEAVETKFGGKVVEVKEIYDLWQAKSEIDKLLAYANGNEITEADVRELTAENGEVDALKIVNAIADRDKQQALKLAGEFLADGDSKAQAIQLNALLSEQFRNILVVQDFVSRRLPESEVLDKTGWKPGRLFITKKNAARFPQSLVKDTLNKLAAFDEELKSSTTPPRVLLDLILTQLFL